MSNMQQEYQTPNGVKKSLYVFLCSIMGMLLFLILHRLGALAYFSLTGSDLYQGLRGDMLLELALEYFTLFFFILAGSWYGIWLGLGWYNMVYENPDCMLCKTGFISHIVREYWPKDKSKSHITEKVKLLSQQIENKTNEPQIFSKPHVKLVLKKPKAIRKKIIRKNLVKKVL